MQGNERRQRRQGWIWALVLVVAAIGTFVNSLDGEFVYDDRHTVLSAQYLRSLWPPWQALWAEKELPVAGRPLSSLSFALNYAVGGFDVRGYHAVNLLLHAACGLALFGVVRRTLRGPLLRARVGDDATHVAGATALLWIVHPLQAECAVYVVARTESLMALFYLGTLYAAIRAGEERSDARWPLVAIALCFGGVLTKEAMATAPLVAVLYDLVFRREQPAALVARRRSLWLGLAASWIPLALIMSTAPRGASIGFDHGVGAWQYLLNQCEIIVGYFSLVIWPDTLVIHYGFAKDLTLADVWPQAALLVALALGSLVALVRRSPWGFLGLWVFVILAPTSSFVPIWTEIGADRRMYLPSAAFVVAFVWLLHQGLRRFAAASDGASLSLLGRAIGAVVVLALAVPLAVRSASRSEEFRTRESLWRAQVEQAPEIPQGWFSLGRVLHARGELGAAADPYLRALRLKSDYIDARVNLGNLRLQQGNAREAERQFLQALELHGDLAYLHANLGTAVLRQRRVDDALAHYERALELDPDEVVALSGVAEILATHPVPEKRDDPRARELSERACVLTGYGNAQALEVWSLALARGAMPREALAVAERALLVARAMGERVEYYEKLFEQRRREAMQAAR